MAEDSKTEDLFTRLPRCIRPAMPSLRRFDVVEGDNAVVRRRKWGERALAIYLTPCNNNPTGRCYDCPRCSASFLQAMTNPPEGPWAP